MALLFHVQLLEELLYELLVQRRSTTQINDYAWTKYRFRISIADYDNYKELLWLLKNHPL